jgi:diguanylate cyclase (GGDEF)-like protein
VRAIRQRWPRQLDHYYWLTASLAAHDMQKSACRVVAAVIVCLGAIPPTLIASSAGPQGLPNRALAVSVAICCLVMGALWLRQRWPTRTESQLCVMAGTVCIAAAALIAADPVLGLLGSTTFVVVSAFTVVFHGGRLLAFTWTIGAATLGVLAGRLAATDPALATCSVVLVALINVFVAFAARMALRLLDTTILDGDIEPLTGLLNRDAFYDRVDTLIGARSRREDRHLVVIVVNLDGFSLLTAITGKAGAHRARVAIGQHLRETVRRDAIIAHVGEAEFLIAEPFTTPDPSALAERVRRCITTAPFRLTASIGVVSTALRPLANHPPPEVLDELLTLATSAMYEARRAGGNQYRLLLAPPLTVLDDPPDDNWMATDESA